MKLNNVSLKQLRVFVAIADHGSFVGAAEALGLSQPALSQSIRQLEDSIGSRLFLRTTRRVQISSVGLSFLPQARHLLRQFDTAIEDIRDIVARTKGRVVVACLPSVAYRLLPPVIARNTRMFPGIQVTIHDANLKGVVDEVVSGKADCAIGSMHTDDPELESVKIARDRMHAVIPRGHPLETRDQIRWKDLAGHPFIAMTGDTGIRELVDNAVQQRDIRLQVTAEVSNLATVTGMLEEGLGVSALPGLALPRDDNPAITHRPLVDPVIDRVIRLMWRRSVGLSPAASSILSSLRAGAAEDTPPPADERVTWLATPADAPETTGTPQNRP